MYSSVRVSSIEQMDSQHFCIEWTDGEKLIYRLSDLQGACPCAQCLEEKSSETPNRSLAIDEDVSAKRIFSVGRYALRIEFSKGCSRGIYDFDFLRHFSKASKALGASL